MRDLIVFMTNMFPAIDFESETTLVENGLLDSLDLFGLIAALEQQYNVSIPVEDISPENFNSVVAIFSLITRLSKGS